MPPFSEVLEVLAPFSVLLGLREPLGLLDPDRGLLILVSFRLTGLGLVALFRRDPLGLRLSDRFEVLGLWDALRFGLPFFLGVFSPERFGERFGERDLEL